MRTLLRLLLPTTTLLLLLPALTTASPTTPNTLSPPPDLPLTPPKPRLFIAPAPISGLAIAAAASGTITLCCCKFAVAPGDHRAGRRRRLPEEHVEEGRGELDGVGVGVHNNNNNTNTIQRGGTGPVAPVSPISPVSEMDGGMGMAKGKGKRDGDGNEFAGMGDQRGLRMNQVPVEGQDDEQEDVIRPVPGVIEEPPPTYHAAMKS